MSELLERLLARKEFPMGPPRRQARPFKDRPRTAPGTDCLHCRSVGIIQGKYDEIHEWASLYDDAMYLRVPSMHVTRTSSRMTSGVMKSNANAKAGGTLPALPRRFW